MGKARTSGRGPAKAKKPVLYLAKQGSRLTDDDATKIVGPVIECIATANGGKATPKAVLDAARVQSSPIHRFFEWDDAKAAEAYRLDQASYLIRSIEVQYTGKPEDRVRAFHIVRSEDASGYAPIGTILSSQDMTKQLIQRAKAELASWARRYQSIQHAVEISGIFAALEDAGVVEPAAPLANAAE
jgi:hypothetical protein